MITLLMDAAKTIINSVIKPTIWTVDNAQGHVGLNYPRVAFESTILKHSIKTLDPVDIKVSGAFQYQVNFRFDGRLKYEDLPRRELTNILSYLTFIFSSHPSLLEKSVEDLDAYSIWQYQKVDPCLYDLTNSRYSVDTLNLNTFIPIIEQSNNDWLMVMVLSFDVDFIAKKSEYRRFFSEVLTDQIDANPGLTGGLIGEINSLEIGVRDKKTSRLAAERLIELNP